MKHRENLSFSHPLVYLLILPVAALMAYGLVQQLILDRPFGDHPLSDTWLVLVALLTFLSLALVLLARLRYQLDERGLHYRFMPFHLKEHHIGWEEVKDIRLRKYDALAEFGGWGIRLNLSGNKAYNVMRDDGQGLEIEKKDGKKILFSSRKPQEARAFIERLVLKG
jgi:hypothetical protein